MEGVERVFLRFLGEIGVWSLDRLWEYDGEFSSTDTVDALAEPLSRAAVGESGRGLSSREKMDRSSPFH